ncbi:MAG: hypothetical protein JW809_12415 [Pirellulales bacterium]|nr:hypothetical protein [Pirellulales bacterium]
MNVTRVVQSAVLAVGLTGLLTPAPAQDARQAAASRPGAKPPEEADFVRLPDWTASAAPGPSQRFTLDPGQTRAEIWGRGRAQPAHYFDEFLPGLLQRTLVFDEALPAGSKLEWVFTGPDGGVSVILSDSALEVRQRFYDSTGLGRIRGATRAKHPEYVTDARRAAIEGKIRAVGVTMDYRLHLAVALNGKEVFAQRCPIDLVNHQLRLEGDKNVVRGSCVAPAGKTCAITVDPAARHQTMLGFGGIATPTAYAQLSPEGKRRWWELACEYNLLIQREYPIGTRLNREADNWDRLADATPHYYGDNFPNGEISDFQYIRTLRALGGKVWFEFWKLPPWTLRDWRDPKGRPRRGVVNPKEYVRAMLAYCRASKERAGAPPDVVGVQNEIRQPSPLWEEMTLALRKALDENGFADVRIHMSDASRLGAGLEWLADLRKSPEAWAVTDFTATHLYDFQNCLGDPDRFDAPLLRWRELSEGKPFLSTELCVNSQEYQWRSYRLALSMGQLYHKNLVLADAAAICYCWTLLNVAEPSYGWTRTLFVPDAEHGFVPKASSHQLRVFGAFSRRIREGMVRVEARSGDPDVLVCAFAGADGRRTVVALNRSTGPRSVTVNWPDGRFTMAEIVDPYHENARLVKDGQPVPDAIVVPPGAIVTLTNVAGKVCRAEFEDEE